MWKPRRLTTLWAFTACYRDSFIYLFENKAISRIFGPVKKEVTEGYKKFHDEELSRLVGLVTRNRDTAN
jgi:hypothetical protein